MSEESLCISREMRSRIVPLEKVTDAAPYLSDQQELYLVYDRNVAWVAEELRAALPQSRGAFPLETSEEQKTLETVQNLCRQLLDAGASRGAMLVAIGGGITTDIVGFVAATYKRGIRYCNFPTTLLAQVDAAIGGKTGVNLDGYKNMVGAFHLPEITFLCAQPLETLPERELHSGLAELLKTFLIADGAAYKQVVSLRTLPVSLIQKAAAIKAGIVQRDPFEKGERAVLNLGHSFGHAIEHEARMHGDDITHGEAVAMGILLAAGVSEQEGLAEKGLQARLKADFQRLGLPTECPYPAESLQKAMARDKKADGEGRVRLVLLRGIGQVELKWMQLHDLHINTE